MIVPITTACFLAAAQAYTIPEGTFFSIANNLERGWEGLAQPNLRRDGSVRSEDLGRWQVNSSWVPTFTAYWKQPDDRSTYLLLRDDGCANAYAAAAIVRYYWQMTGNLERAIAFYHTGPKGSPTEMSKYLGRYRNAMTANGYGNGY